MNRFSTLALALVLAAPGLAQVPRSFGVQARLHESGAPVTDPTTVTLALYDVASGGASFHSELQMVFPDANGVFATTLGPGLDPEDFGGDAWLGVSIDGSPETTPRVAVLPAPSALRAGAAETLVHHSVVFQVTDGTSSVSVGDRSAVLLDWSARTSAATFSIHLPDPAAAPGRQVTVATIDSGASLPRNMEFTSPGGDIAGQTSPVGVSFTDRTESFLFMSDGTNWVVVGGAG